MNWNDTVNIKAIEDKKVKDMIDILFLESIKKEIQEDRSQEIHITDLVSPCPRNVWYGKKYPEINIERIDESGWKKMWSGKKLHETAISLEGHEFELRYRFSDEPYGVIVGSADEVIDNMVIDKKFYGFLPREPYPHHIKQVLYYMALLWKMGKSIRYGAIYYIERKNLETRAFVFEADEELLEKAFNEMIEKAEYLRDNLISGKLPEKVDSWMCKYCKFKDMCENEEVM